MSENGVNIWSEAVSYMFHMSFSFLLTMFSESGMLVLFAHARNIADSAHDTLINAHSKILATV